MAFGKAKHAKLRLNATAPRLNAVRRPHFSTYLYESNIDRTQISSPPP